MSGAATYCDWIAVDWGTSNLRVWAMLRDGTVIAEAQSDQGMGSLTSAEFEPALLSLIEPWLSDVQMPVLACGMVGSRQGWHEARYVRVPCAPSNQTVVVPTEDPRLLVHILPGLKQDIPPDVMRGEETQIAGFLAKRAEFDGVLCLPGTHSKWVRISAGEVVSFQTFMTGEIFALLSKASVLRHSVGASGGQGFEDAVTDALSRPEALGAKLFQLRAADLLTGLSAEEAHARLSGLLIGVELAAAKPYWLGQQIALLGAPTLTRNYARALATQGAPLEEVDGNESALRGLTAAYLELDL